MICLRTKQGRIGAWTSRSSAAASTYGAFRGAGRHLEPSEAVRDSLARECATSTTGARASNLQSKRHFHTISTLGIIVGHGLSPDKVMLRIEGPCWMVCPTGQCPYRTSDKPAQRSPAACGCLLLPACKLVPHRSCVGEVGDAI